MYINTHTSLKLLYSDKEGFFCTAADFEHAVASPKGSNWHWLVVTGSCWGLLCSVTGKLGWLPRSRPRGGSSGPALTQTEHTHKRGQRGPMQKVFTVFFRAVEHRSLNLCVFFGCVWVSASACFHWRLNLLYQDKVDYTNPLYCFSPPFTSHPFSHYSVVLGERREKWKGVSGPLFK